MKPALPVFNSLANLFAADASTIAPVADALHLHLSKTNFTPSQDRVAGDFTDSDFDGYAPIDSVVGAQVGGIDPLTGERIVQLKIPAGGWRWHCTGVTNLPQLCYGVWLTDNSDAVLFGCALFDAPITIASSGDIVEIGDVTFRFRFNGIY